MRNIGTAVTIAAMLVSLAACEKQDAGAPPQAPSSAGQATYAEEYPDTLDQVTGRIDKGKAEVAEKSGTFAGYADQVNDPTDWDIYRQVVEAADASGKSAGYAERAQENEAIEDLLAENDGEVRKRVASGVSYAAKQAGCGSDLGGAAAGAMTRAFDKRMEERLKERNEAYKLIDRHEEQLGKKNVATLEKQSDDIARSSYVANVQLPTERAKLQRLADERDEVAATIDDQIQQERDYQATPGVSDKAKKASDARIADLDKAKADLQATEPMDEQKLQQLDQEITAAQDAHQKALDELLGKIGDKGGNAPPAEASAEVEAG
jgi:hypothetical protein